MLNLKLRIANIKQFSKKSRLSILGTLILFGSCFLGFGISTVSAQALPSTLKHADTPFPQIHLPCDKTKDPEFNSLRPYQAAACGDANQASFCGNSLQFVETFDLSSKCTPPNGQTEGKFICKLGDGFKVQKHMLTVDLDGSQLPILGNTELTKNSQSNTDQIDDATKMSEYASWYLQGTTNKAEYGPTDPSKVVDFAGPIQKIMPGVLLDAQRVATLNLTKETTPIVDENGTASGGKEPENHNQIVVCAKEGGGGFLGFVQDIFGIGKTTPVPCYDGGGKANGDVYRLKKRRWG